MRKNYDFIIRKIISTEFFGKIIVTWVFLWSLVGTFGYINKIYDHVAPEVFFSSCVPGYFPRISDKTLAEAYIYYTTNISITKPISIFYNAVPYFKATNRAYNFYEDEIDGYFKVAEDETLLDLKKDNIYTPKLPTPKKIDINLSKLGDYRYVKQYFVSGNSVQEGLGIDKELLNQWNFKKLAKKPFSLGKSVGPKILIYHTHVKERYIDEGEWNPGDGVAAVGERFANILETEYGIETLHITDSVYPSENSENVSGAYERIEMVVNKVLKENPSIEMCIDIHRDGVEIPGKLVTNIKGKPTAKTMFVTGVCQTRNKKGELLPTKNLVNPYIEDNIALALQGQIQGHQYYPGLFRKIYFKPYRYSLHMKPMSLLIEVGMQNNTKAEAVNAAEPLAHIISKVLEKD